MNSLLDQTLCCVTCLELGLSWGRSLSTLFGTFESLTSEKSKEARRLVENPFLRSTGCSETLGSNSCGTGSCCLFRGQPGIPTVLMCFHACHLSDQALGASRGTVHLLAAACSRCPLGRIPLAACLHFEHCPRLSKMGAGNKNSGKYAVPGWLETWWYVDGGWLLELLRGRFPVVVRSKISAEQPLFSSCNRCSEKCGL